MDGRKNFIKKFDSVFESNSKKTAVEYLLDSGGKKAFTYGDLHEQAKHMAQTLQASGLAIGDRAAILSALSPYCYIAYFAFVYAGLTAVIIDPKLPDTEKDRLLANADIRGIASSESLYAYAEKFNAQMPLIDIESGQLFNKNQYAPQPPTPDPDTEAAAILYSSGTTSQAKGVVIGFEQQLKAAEIDVELIGTNDVRWLMVFPFFHISGMATALTCLFHGAELGLIEDVNPVKLQQAFQAYRPNMFALVPKVYEVMEGKIRAGIKAKGFLAEKVLLSLTRFCGFVRKHTRLNLGKKLFSSINRQVFGGNMKFLCVGGGLSKPETVDFFFRLGYVMINAYASTEANLPIASTTHKDKYPVGISGRIDRFPNIHIVIDNPNEHGEGEILVKSNMLMKGYFREPELTAAAFDSHVYFKTGDLGHINKRNELIITGRAKEFICLHNGEKVSPEDIERLYAEAAKGAAFACAAVPAKDGSYDMAHLFIEKNEMYETAEITERVLSFSAETSGNYRIAKVHFVDKLPMTSIGKVKRFELKKIALAEESHGN